MAAAVNKIEKAHQMYRQGQHGEALGLYTEALTMAKSKAQKIALHSNRAACYLKLHDFQEAAEECTAVLELDREHTGALMLRAQTLVTLKEYQSALFDVNRLMELNPSSDVYRNLQTRLRTQLSLAPIPESEEEAHHLEEDDVVEVAEAKEKEGEITSAKVEKKVESPRIKVEAPIAHHLEEDEDVVEVAEAKEKEGEIISAKVEKKVESPRIKVEPPITKNHDIEPPHNVLPKVKGWEAIPKPKGHSGLDYSRWDRVEDDSSEEEEDDEAEDQQPKYRFRLKTVGVRPVK